ncbi:MAG: hypothetical protein QXP81_09485 [Nitrososphaerota archaeon]
MLPRPEREVWTGAGEPLAVEGDPVSLRRILLARDLPDPHLSIRRPASNKCLEGYHERDELPEREEVRVSGQGLYFERDGWLVVRAARSKPVDLVCIRDGKVVLVECKYAGGRLTRKRREFLEGIARRFGVEVLVAFKKKRRGMVIERIVGPRESAVAHGA